MAADDIRIADQDRQAVVDRLSAACGEGYFTLEEFSELAGAAYAAVSRSDLEAVVRDSRLPVVANDHLPASAAGASESDGARRRHWIVAVFGGARRRGRWRPAPRLRAVAIMGGAHIDLRDAVVSGHDIQIVAGALMGSVHVIVPPGIPVDVTGFAVFGSRSDDVGPEQAITAGPRVHVRGYGLFGSIHVVSRP